MPSGLAALLDDVLRAGEAAGLDLVEAPLLRAETLARHGDCAEALAETARLKEVRPDWLPGQTPTIDLLGHARGCPTTRPPPPSRGPTPGRSGPRGRTRPPG